MASSTTFVTTGTNKAGKKVTTEITVTKTGKKTGKIRVRKWIAPKKRGKDSPNEDDTNDLIKIKCSKDGSKLRAEIDVSWYDPIITIKINCPKKPKDPKKKKKKPTVTVTITGANDANNGTKVYQITEKIQDQLLKFNRQASFPKLAMLDSSSGLDGMAAMVDRPSVLGDVALGRLALSISDVANSIAKRGDDWIVRKPDKMLFIGHDPGVNANIKVKQRKGKEVAILSISISSDIFKKDDLEFVDGFIHPDRAETVEDVGTNSSDSIVDLCLIDDETETETVEVEAELDEVIARLVNNKGKTIGYELRSGKNISSRSAFDAAEAGLLKNVEGAKRGQTLYIRAAKDASTDNNLKNLITRTFTIETGFDSL